jgi:hypothetical protein
VRRFLTPRWLLRHLATLGLVAAFLALGWWQVGRAAGGNSLSLGYAIEWPVFALFVIFVWYREIRAELRRASGVPAPAPPPPVAAVAVPERRPVVPDTAEDPELAAYNRYLEWLNANPDRRPSDYRALG